MAGVNIPMSMISRTWIVLAALVLVVPGVQRLPAAPEPEAIPRRWELRVEPGDLRVTRVEVPGRGAQAFFYMTFKATNLSGQDLYFAPSMELALSSGTVIRAGRDVPSEAVNAILAYINNPFLQEESKLQGNFLQGAENAKEGLAVWPAASLKLNEATVYLSGFSGETKTVIRPDTGKPHVLRKTLMLRHDINGELDPSANAALTRTAQRWILR